MTLRITPIPDKPVRTEREYRKREAAKQQAALHEKLMREVKEKAREHACRNDDGLDPSRPVSQADVLVPPRMGA